MQDTYVVNGVDLRSKAWRIATGENLQDTPDLRGDDIVVPTAHGVLDPYGDPALPRRRYGAGSIVFHMWLLGVDPVTGAPPVDPTDGSEYFARLGELQRLFNARPLTIEHPRPDGTRVATARLAAPLKPVREPSSPWYGSIEAACTIPGAFWLDAAGDITVSSGAVVSGSFIDLTALACDAPITDAQLRFATCNNPSLIQGGSFFAYDTVVPSGKELVVNTATWKTDYGAGGAWATDDTKVRYGPGPTWFELDTTADPLQVAFTHTGGGTASCSITATRKHLSS